MDYPRLFGNRLRAMKKSAKLTQEKLAESARLNHKYLGQLERGACSRSESHPRTAAKHARQKRYEVGVLQESFADFMLSESNLHRQRRAGRT